MAEDDPDTLLCYYLWANRGWTPSQYVDMPYREQLLVAEFVMKEVQARKEQMDEIKKRK